MPRLLVVHANDHLPRWQHSALGEAAAAGLALQFAHLRGPPPPAGPGSRWVALADRRLFGAEDTATAAEPIALLGGERRHCPDRAALAAWAGDCEAVLQLAPHGDDRALAAACGRPVLRPQLSADDDHRHSPEGLWEALNHAPVIGSRLQLQRPGEAAPRVLERGYSRADDASPIRCREAAAWRCAGALARALCGLEALLAGADRLPLESPLAPAGLPSLARAFAQVPLHFARRALRSRARRGQREQWILLHAPPTAAAAGPRSDLAAFTRILPPPDRFWADPFVVQRDGRCWVFIEEASFSPRRGHLAVIEIDRDGQLLDHQVILKHDTHLSYPQVFARDGEWWLLPESGESGALWLYRCTAWPAQWRAEIKLLERPLYDATPLWHGGRCYLFANAPRFACAGPDDELSIWHSETLFSDRWTPHAANPVLCDVRRARMAGPFFHRAGAIIRPSQHGGGRYGNGFHLNRIDQLDPEHFAETTLSTHLPDWDADIVAQHHLSEDGGWSLADASWWRPLAG